MPVILYVATGCPHSDAAVSDFRRRGVDFRLVNLTEHPEALGELRVVSTAGRVPVIVDHERVTVGFKMQSTPLPTELLAWHRA